MKKCPSCKEVLDPKTLAINDAVLTIEHLDLFKSCIRINYTAVYTCRHCHEVLVVNRSRYLSPKEMAYASELNK